VAWHERRKENHKRVERKRREMINRAMDDLSAVIPGNDKNKSKLLGRAVQHIKALGDEVRALQSQLDQYRLTEQRNKADIDALKARLSSA
jgi:bHLH factor